LIANLHLNIHAPEYTDKTTNLVEPFVYEYTSQHKGSISAEHGLGAMKANCIHYSKSPVAVEMMRTIKNAFDPYGIMNPYKVLPQEFKNL
jgi:D-2-hydroxyglutarate dehydrogenase